MSKKMHVAKTYHVEYADVSFNSIDGQKAFFNILELFEIENSAESPFTNEYQIERSELVRLRDIINSEQSFFQEYYDEFEEALQEAGDLTKESFLNILEKLINDSDQNNSTIVISWW